MENIEMNQTAVAMLAAWDPLGYGADSYDTETADVVAALQGLDDVEKLAHVIQTVYEHSFEQWIPMDDCLKMADKLILLKQQVSCER